MKPRNGNPAKLLQAKRQKFVADMVQLLARLGIETINVQGDDRGLRVTYQRAGAVDVRECPLDMVALEETWGGVFPQAILPIAVSQVLEHANGDGQAKLEGVAPGACAWCGRPLAEETSTMLVVEVEGERRGVQIHEGCAGLRLLAEQIRPRCEACGVDLEPRPRGPGGKAKPGQMHCPKCGGAYRVAGAQA